MEITLKTDYPVAYDSPDHIMPHGTKNDNHTNLNFINEVLQEWKTPNFMDLGCSGGQLVVDFVNKGCLAVGLEGSDYSVKHKRANWPEYHNTNLFTADITKPYEVYNNGERVYFNVITAWEVVEHIHPHDLDNFFEHISNNLTPGGIFLASIATHSDIVNGVELHQSCFPKENWIDGIFPGVCERYNLELHPYPYKNKVREGGSFHIMLKKL